MKRAVAQTTALTYKEKHPCVRMLFFISNCDFLIAFASFLLLCLLGMLATHLYVFR